MTESDCPFCNAGIKKSAYLESSNFRAVYNIAPVLPGHSLIIPKKHLESFTELTDMELLEMMVLTRKTQKVLGKVFNTEAFSWTVQEKEEAGQTILHLHLHIIPRIKGDLPEPGDWYPLLMQEKNKFLDSKSRPEIQTEHLEKIIKILKQTAREL